MKQKELNPMGSFEDAFLKAFEDSKQESEEISQCSLCTDIDCECVDII